MKFLSILILFFSLEAYPNQSELLLVQTEEEQQSALEIAENLYTTRLIAESANLKMKRVITDYVNKSAIHESNPHYKSFLNDSIRIVDKHLSIDLVANLHAQALVESTTIEHLKILNGLYQTSYGKKIGKNIVVQQPLKTGLTTSDWNNYISYLQKHRKEMIEYFSSAQAIGKRFGEKLSFPFMRVQSEYDFLYKERLDRAAMSR